MPRKGAAKAASNDPPVATYLIGGDFTYSDVSESDNGGEALHSDYECCVCLAPAFDPVQHDSCGQMFCKKCVDNLDACPTCRGAPLATKPVTLKLVLNKLNALNVVCPTCEKDVLRRDLAQHLPLCPVPCPEGCGVSVQPSQQLAHKAFHCNNTVVKCSASDAMCPWSGERKLLPKHEEDCHYVALSPVLLQLLRETRNLRRDFEELKNSVRATSQVNDSSVVQQVSATENSVRRYYPHRVGAPVSMSSSRSDNDDDDNVPPAAEPTVDPLIAIRRAKIIARKSNN